MDREDRHKGFATEGRTLMLPLILVGPQRPGIPRVS